MQFDGILLRMRENTATTTITHDGSYPWLSFTLIACFVLACIGGLPKQVSSDCIPKGGCTALAYIVATENDTLASIVDLFNSSSASTLRYSNLSSSGNLTAGEVLLVPFPCQCMENNQLGQIFHYTIVQGDTAFNIAHYKYRFLTNDDSLITANPPGDLGRLYPQNILNIPVNCSCGNPAVSSQYGLFASYVTLANDNLLSLSTKFNLSTTFLQEYNDGKNINSLIPNIDVLFIPMKGGLPKQVSSDCIPKGGCTALAYIAATENDTLASIVDLFNSSNASTLWYSNLSSSGNLTAGEVLLIPFPCQCMENNQLGQIFHYTVVQGDTGLNIAQNKYRFLTNYDSLITANPTRDLGVLYPQNILNIPVNCSCGNPDVSSQYGLFASYVTLANDNLLSLSIKFNLSATFLQEYNVGKNINSLIPNIDVLFIPMKDGNGTYPPFNTSALGGGGVSTGTIVGATVGGVIALLLILLVVFFYARKIHRKAKIQEPKKERSVNAVDSQGSRLMSGSRESEASNLSLGSPSMANLAMDKSILFTYEELAQATDNFNLTKEIGRGGFGAVYYGEINGQRLAIKKMDIQATREFYAELKVLTNVHHTNLVRLIGYCAEHESLFVVYEYVDNGTLSQHLKPSKSEGRPPLSWAARVQIALDSARGLEYIHEHTTPTYIHRDIKSANILIDKNFRAKVADFGLTKLRETGVGTSSTLPSRLVGTFGYMAPEYARFGDMSVKADVYSFGVVLFEIISAKNAILNNMDSSSSSQGIVGLFEPVLNDLKGEERMKALIDPALGDDYPPEAVWKMAQLAGACTKMDPKLRPNMRSVVVALMTLSSTSISISWLGGPFSQDHSVSALMSGQ